MSKEILKKVDKLLIKHDIYGLIEGGAPKDEYDDLTARLVSLLINSKQTLEKEDLFKEIGQIVVNLYDDNYYKDRLENLASDLLDISKNI